MLDKIDLILVMTVNPGFGGQKFLTSQLAKISLIKTMLTQTAVKDRNISIQVDGGIDATTAPLVKKAGAQVLVSGSAIFNSDDYRKTIALLAD